MKELWCSATLCIQEGPNLSHNLEILLIRNTSCASFGPKSYHFWLFLSLFHHCFGCHGHKYAYFWNLSHMHFLLTYTKLVWSSFGNCHSSIMCTGSPKRPFWDQIGPYRAGLPMSQCVGNWIVCQPQLFQNFTVYVIVEGASPLANSVSQVIDLFIQVGIWVRAKTG